MTFEVDVQDALGRVSVSVDGSQTQYYIGQTVATGDVDAEAAASFKQEFDAATDVQTFIESAIADGTLVESVVDSTPTAPGTPVEIVNQGVGADGNTPWDTV